MAIIIPVNSIAGGAPAFYEESSEVLLARIDEPEPGIFIAESDKVLLRALDAGYLPVSLLLESKVFADKGNGLIARCEEALASSPASVEKDSRLSLPGDFPVYVADYETLKGLIGYNLTGGVLCAMRRKPLPPVAEVCNGASRIAVLENVVNPTNIGAIFRSAAAMRIDAVLLTMGCCDPLYRRAVRVSMGNVFLVPWTYLRPTRKRAGASNRWESEEASADSGASAESAASGASAGSAASGGTEVSAVFENTEPSVRDRMGWPSPWLDKLKAMGYTTVAMALDDDSVSISDPALKQAEKLAIILGTEGDGLQRRTIASCDYTAKIPMAEGVDSLNVAAASAVAFWELRK